ncbi:hypothetical protein SYJ56_08605 [Algoriphagus sp. D3-2-R+10]|uniref:hypothetical protein n=1 Tax=Algoriphagus aurantiacus TaxID=3103948 RepID=UPI002B3BA2E1|nr:hypothetical protein [Algoriphagus sp. D3-2-R+10]MEB2775366.1 hypothetical protein [Algoriphagus sp. D3-2-R+10]
MIQLALLSIREILALSSQSEKIFKSSGVDIKTHGHKTLSEVCLFKRLDLAVILENLNDGIENTYSELYDYKNYSLSQLIQYIKTVYHDSIRGKSELIMNHLQTLVSSKSNPGDQWKIIFTKFSIASTYLFRHMKQEELIIFPYIRAIERDNHRKALFLKQPFLSVVKNIHQLMQEPYEEDNLFEQIKILTEDCRFSNGSTNHCQEVFILLQDFNSHLYKHILLEQNILFPRVFKQFQEDSKTISATYYSMLMKRKIWLLIPIITGTSVFPFLFGFTELGLIFLLAGSLGLSIIMHLQTLKHPGFHSTLLYIGSAFWFIGNLLAFQTGLIAAGSTWWIGFLLFTIVGERLELSQFLPVPTWSKIALKLLLALFAFGLIIPFHSWGNELMGLSSFLIALWLLTFDMAKVAARKTDQFRYIGIGLRVGYVWLGIHGTILLGIENHILYYDLLLHTFFLGFTFSMIWAHAPIIFPTVTGIRETLYHPILWLGWLLFQISLAGRIFFSLIEAYELRKAFGLANSYVILIQFGLMAAIVIWKIKEKEPSDYLNREDL